jgi:hypothetical protein
MRNKYKVRLLISSVRGQIKDIMDQLKFEKAASAKVPNGISHVTLTLQVVFTSTHDAVLFAVRNGSSPTYLQPNASFENEETSRVAFDASMQLGGVSCPLIVCHV